MEGSPNKENGSKLMKKKELTIEDGHSYIDKINRSQPKLYREFSDIMTLFRHRRLYRVGVIQRVATLFRGHPELIEGFNTFLPYGYEIEVQSNEQARQVYVANFDHTTSLVSQSSTPFSGESQVSAAFDREKSSDIDRSSLVESLISFRGHFIKENEEIETSSSSFSDSSSTDSSDKSSFSLPKHFEEEYSETSAAASDYSTEDP